MLGELVPCAGGPPIPLCKPKLLLGRHTGCDVSLCYSTISTRHCELEFRDGYWFVRDLNSSNGTRVNGAVCESKRLMPNDILALAKERYTIVYTPPAGRPPPEQESTPAAMAAPAWSAAPEQAGTRLGELIPCGGGDPILLLKVRLVLGRHPGCDIVLRSAAVSGRHCQLDWDNDAWTVRDLGSRNGIRVDGERCESKRLGASCVLSIADLRYRLVTTPPGRGRATAHGPVFAQSLLEAAGLGRWQPSATGMPKDDPDQPRPKYTLDDME